MKIRLTIILALLLSHTVSISAQDSPGTSSLAGTRPNIIFVLSDDTGWGEVGASGNSVIQTPHMDRLHNEGARLMNFHVASLCAPTRAQLMSGRHNLRAGVVGTSPPESTYMHPHLPTVADVLKQAGYATGMFGKWHLGEGAGYEPHERGFDTAVRATGPYPKGCNFLYDVTLFRNGVPDAEPSSGYRTDVLFDEAMRWIEQHKEQPFFCYLPTFNAHTKLEVDKAFSDLYEDKNLLEWQNPQLAKDLRRAAVYYGMHTNLDHNIGRLMQFVEANGLGENTLIIYASDNGHAMGGATKVGHHSNGHLEENGLYNVGMRGGKSQIWRGGTCVPCFFYWPEKIRANTEVNRVAGGIDLLPTLAAFAGAEIPEGVDGQSLLPLMEDPTAEMPDRWLVLQQFSVPNLLKDVTETSEPDASMVYAIQGDHHRLIHGSKHEKGNVALYDHRTDPGEKHRTSAPNTPN